MGDPFEQPTAPARTGAQASAVGIRESSVQQAIVFLSDPRVRGADLNKAAAFLRSKGVTEDEIRQAFARSGLIYPPPHPNGAHGVSNFPANSVYFPTSATHEVPSAHPPPRSSSWWPLVLGVAAAAAVYSAGREILRQYVVPLYFPDAAQGTRGGSSGGEIPSSARRGPQHVEGYAGRGNEEMAKLTERVNALSEVSKRTTDSVERLTQTVDAAREKNDRSAVAITELRDAIRLLSQSISASRGGKQDDFGNDMSKMGVTGQSSSVAVIDTSSVMADDDREEDGFKDSRRSSLRGPFGTTNNRKMGILAYGTSGASSMAGTNESTYASGRTERPSIEKGEMENDDFLNLAPAEIQDDWRCIGREARSSDERESHVSTKSGDGARDSKADSKDEDTLMVKRKEEIVEGVGDENEKSDRSLTSGSVADMSVTHATADADIPTDCGVDAETGVEDSTADENNGSTWNEASRDSNTSDDHKVGRYKESYGENGSRDYDRSPYGIGDSGGRGIAAARMLFEADILAETRGLFGHSGAVTGSGAKSSSDRPVSMPAMDAPLSDVE